MMSHLLAWSKSVLSDEATSIAHSVPYGVLIANTPYSILGQPDILLTPTAATTCFVRLARSAFVPPVP